MMTKKKTSIDTLFSKYIQSQCDEAEIRLLFQQFNLSENEELLKQAILLELEKPHRADTIPADLDVRLAAVQDKVTGHRISSKIVKKSVILRLWPRIAVAAAIIVMIPWAIFHYSPHQSLDHLKQQIAVSKIKPGKNQAVLTLANGNKVPLNAINGQPVYFMPSASAGSTATYNTIEVPAGGQWQVVLSDGTHVWLNALSSITYPTAFSGAERKVQVSGEVYFEVAHNKALPFRVLSAGQTLEVLGTKFNITAYPGEPEIRTTLLQGSVRIAVNKEEKILKPGEQARVRAEGISVSADNIDIEEIVAWKNGYFKFNGNINDIMSKISRWYNVQVIYESTPDPAYSFEGEISRSRDLSEVLNMMQYTGEVQFKVEGRRIIVKK
jgi:transmembrane sensor